MNKEGGGGGGGGGVWAKEGDLSHPCNVRVRRERVIDPSSSKT